jgi:DNA-binding PadR family transcriptional regulator
MKPDAANGEKRAISADGQSKLSVSEHEGTVLSVVARGQPLTRYQILRTLERSPTTSYNTSKGSLYPLVTRMLERGFLEAESISSGRERELLRLTEEGKQALRLWILTSVPQQLVGHDALLLRILSLEDLPEKERVRWIAEAKAMLLKRRDELKAPAEALVGPYADIVHGTAVAMIQVKLEWLDRLLIQIMSDADARIS